MLERVLHNRYFDLNRFIALGSGLPWMRPDRLLPVLFVGISVLDLARHYPEVLGIDARIYIRAAMAFRLGTDPWAATVANGPASQLHFAALPPSVLAFVPLTYLQERTAVWVMIWISAGSAVWIVRRLHLPGWWLLFPPLVEGVFAANPQILLVALLLTNSSLLRGMAPMVKIYGVAPLVGERWLRAIAAAAALLFASYAVAPDLWTSYLSRSGEIASRLLTESGGGYAATFSNPPLLAATVVGVGLLAMVDLRAAGWLVAPALVPASQFHLSTMAMPVVARIPSVALAVLFALPVHGVPSAIVAVYGTLTAYRVVRARRLHKAAGALPATD